MNLYKVGMDIMREERGLIGWGQRNSITFDGEACNSDRTLGLDFMSPGHSHQDNCALLDQATRQIIGHINDNR